MINAMMEVIIHFFHTFDWQGILETYGDLSPLVPILIVMAESFLPALPLGAIVAWNIAAYGAFEGTVYSWVGNCLGSTLVFFFFRIFREGAGRYSLKHRRAERIRKWVQGVKTPALFMIIMMPFTPSSLMNLSFGISDYDPVKYLQTLYSAKLFMVLLLAAVSQSIVLSFDSPLWLLPAAALLAVLWYISLKVRKRNRMQDLAEKPGEEID